MENLATDVLVIGGGGAGVTAAVAAAKTGVKVMLLCKEPVGYGDTRIAMGNMAFPGIAAGDTSENFVADVLASGEQLNNRELVEAIATDAVEAFTFLEGFGHLFCRDNQGKISEQVLAYRGGHRLPRVLQSSGGGGGIGQSLRAAAARFDISILEETMAVQILIEANRVKGCLAYRISEGEYVAITAKSIVIATGGAGWLYYPHTDCMRTATGDGYGLALQAGAELVDMEMVQAIPFGITHPKSMMGIFAGESAQAGPAGRLLNKDGQVVLEEINKRTRAEVTKAIMLEIDKGGQTETGGLTLDPTPNLNLPDGKEIWRKMAQTGIFDAARAAYGDAAYYWEKPWDVLPSIHYNMGGIRVDAWGNTSVPGLFAAGQVQGGVHGANRLGSISLAEIFVFGRRAGLRAASYSRELAINGSVEQRLLPLQNPSPGQQGKNRPIELKRQLYQLMWEKVGILRNEQQLKQALTEINHLEQVCRDLSINGAKKYNLEMVDALELPLMLAAAKAITLSALARRESRGAHLRLDYPERDDQNWLVNVIVCQVNGCLETRIEEAAGCLSSQ